MQTDGNPITGEILYQIAENGKSWITNMASYIRGVTFLNPRRKEMAEKSYIWMDPDKVFAEMCENCHGQDNIGSEIKKVEPVGVHDIAKEFRKGRAEPAVEEQGKEGIPSGILIPSSGWEYLRARMRSSLRGKIARSFCSAASRCASDDFAFSAFGAMAGM